ncbi:MAG: glycoside hydrolase [Alistipes sp.]|nr:glycoside hydrolase [Alistipes sp.]
MKKFTTLLIVAIGAILTSCSIREPQIITTADSIADGEWQCFRKEFTLLAPFDAELQIAADTKYWLWVNGELVVREGGLKRGPTPTDSYCDVLDIENLKFGRNTIAVLVQYYGRNSFSHRPSATPGLYFDLKCGARHIVSDEKWSAVRYDAMWAPADENPEGPRQYRLAGANVGYDARKAVDFAAADFDDSAWSKAVEVSRKDAEWGEFVERPIPMWRWSELRDYESVVNDNQGTITGKLPYNAHVTPYIKLRAKGGERIIICTDDYWIGKARSFYTEYIAREGEQEFETPIWTNGHDVLYFVPEGVEVVEVKYRESGYDSDFVGAFTSDSEFCNMLWKKAQRTLYVTMRDNYMDCPDRERAQWWGDVVVELGEAGYVFDERAHLLTRKAILELMMHQQENGAIASPVPGWYRSELPCQMLASVGYYGFYTYYMQTGDKQTIETIYDRVRRYLFHTWEPQNSGLIKVRRGGWYWGDWGKNIDKEALQQCWYAVALRGFAEMARVTGHRSDAMMAEQIYDKLRVSWNEKYWNEELQHYKSDKYKDSPDDRVQAMAVIAGLVPQERYEIIREFLHTHYNASPYMEKYVLEALCMMGYYEDALARMELRFGEMVAAPEYSTLWEGWEYTGARGMQYKSGNGTYNHAWSGGGLTILSQYIAGIAPIEPAFRRFSVEPNLATLNHVHSIVPTPFGNIALAADKGEGVLKIGLTVPENTEAEIRLPQGYTQLTSGEESGKTLTLTAGNYTIEAR